MKNLKSIIESILIVAEKPVSFLELADATGATATDVLDTLKTLSEEYKERGFRITQKGEEYHLSTAPENAEVVAKFLNEELRNDISRAALEVLAIITYKQPITRIEVEEIRGVSSDYLIKNLLIRGLVKEIGRKEALGKPILYGTTLDFLRHLGLEDETELPKLEEIVQVDTITEKV